jgi:hypothetical protein
MEAKPARPGGLRVESPLVVSRGGETTDEAKSMVE